MDKDKNPSAKEAFILFREASGEIRPHRTTIGGLNFLQGYVKLPPEKQAIIKKMLYKIHDEQIKQEQASSKNID